MRKTVSVIKKLLDECCDEDRGEWKSHTQTILRAVRSSHPTRRGVTSAIAAAFFENSAFPALAHAGWSLSRSAPESPFTFSMTRDERDVRVLVAALHQESGKPRRYSGAEAQEPRYIALLPRKVVRTPPRPGSRPGRPSEHESRVPMNHIFSFNDFDLLAVNLQVATRQWIDFRFTLARWLAARADHSFLIAHEQPVPLEASHAWTGDLSLCVKWLTREIPEDRF
jgi:hypothetical protein